jgi:hypothetical protein
VNVNDLAFYKSICGYKTGKGREVTCSTANEKRFQAGVLKTAYKNYSKLSRKKLACSTNISGY